MQEIKNQLISYLPKLIIGINDIAIEFHSNRAENGFKILEQAIEGIDWSCTAYLSLLNEGNGDIDSLNLVLNEFNKALAQKNYLGAGDILEYEVVPIISTMHNRISAIHFN